MIAKDVVPKFIWELYTDGRGWKYRFTFEISSNGYLMYQSGGIHGDQMFPVSNGELLIHTISDTLVRTDSSSTIFWSIPCDGILAASDSFAITFFSK
ncbi:MAG: hypothetical protein IPG90_03905 [Bacteroidetes bacterium]|nr:hypothetical protein [Bacteroidota bacterium]